MAEAVEEAERLPEARVAALLLAEAPETLPEDPLEHKGRPEHRSGCQDRQGRRRRVAAPCQRDEPLGHQGRSPSSSSSSSSPVEPRSHGRRGAQETSLRLREAAEQSGGGGQGGGGGGSRGGRCVVLLPG